MPNNNPSKLVSLRKPNYKGSWWKDYVKERTTMPIGLFTPIRTFDIPANTLFKVKPDIRFESLPMLSPLYDGFTMRTKFYFIPYRLYIPELRKNRQLPWGQVENFRLPAFEISHSVRSANNSPLGANCHVSLAGSLLDRLGIAYGDIYSCQSFNNVQFVRPNISVSDTSDVPAVKFLAYLDCWMRGEYNPQDKNIPVLLDTFIFNSASNAAASSGQYDGGVLSRAGVYRYVPYSLLRNFVDFAYGYETEDDNVFSEVIYRASASVGSSALIRNLHRGGIDDALYPLTTSFKYINENNGQETFLSGEYYGLLADKWDFFRNSVSNVGLLPITYKGDYLMSWYNSEGIARLENYVVNNGDNFITLRQKNADMMLDLLASISGNTYVDILQYVFDTYLDLKDHPIMIGYDELHFGANEDTTATATTGSTGTSVLGAVASKARDYSNKVKPISVKTKEPGMIMVFSSIIPNVVYYQGVDRFDLKLDWADLWHPQYDSRGFQAIDAEEYYNSFTVPTGNAVSGTLYPRYESLVEENFVSPRVPLGWEYMRRNSHLSGAMKLDRFRTWSLRHDFSIVGTMITADDYEANDWADIGQRVSLLSYNTDEQEIRKSVISSLPSTYVKGFDYNIPFANYDAFDNQNFIVNFGFVISQYQPITHTLITKTI